MKVLPLPWKRLHVAQMTTQHGIPMGGNSTLKVYFLRPIRSTGYFGQKSWLLFPFIKVTKERFFADTEGFLYETDGSCPLQISMKPLRNAPKEDLHVCFSDFQMLKNNVEMQI